MVALPNLAFFEARRKSQESAKETQQRRIGLDDNHVRTPTRDGDPRRSDEKTDPIDNSSDSRRLTQSNVWHSSNHHAASCLFARTAKNAVRRNLVRLACNHRDVELMSQVLAKLRQQLAGRFCIRPVGPIHK